MPKRGGKRTDEQPSREMPRREKGVVIEASGEAYTRSNSGRVVTVIPYAGPGLQLFGLEGVSGASRQASLTLESADGELREID